MSDILRLTVAVPSFNGAKHLGEALRSILSQKNVDFDLLVCDDLSEDDTVDVVRQIAGDRVKVIVNDRRLGLAENWNACVRRSTTAWTTIFHQGDVMLPEHLSEHLAAIVDNPDAGLIASSTKAIDENGLEIDSTIVETGGLGDFNRKYGAGHLVQELATRNPLRCSAITLRNDVLAEIGGFDGKYRYVVDWDAWLKIARRYPVVWRAKKTIAFRWHKASETQRFKNGTIDLEETEQLLENLWKEDLSLLNDPVGLRKQARRRLARAYLNRAYDAARATEATLTRHCLKKAVALSPLVLGRIAIDPKLAWRLGSMFTKIRMGNRLRK
ncbi:MAG: hypothetical protein NVSMB14_05030 [Isosphaeraceae bacterium]